MNSILTYERGDLIMKKKIFSFLMTLVLLVGIGFTQNAYAASNWQQTSQGWTYSENGVDKTGWLQNGGKWYYLGYDGIMKTGWVDDKGTWYYLTDKGTLNDFKTTKIIPNEVDDIYKVIRFYAPNAKLYYSGLINPQGSISKIVSDTGFANKSLYKFTEMDDYDNTIEEYYYSPYDGCAYELNQGEVVMLGVGDKTLSNSSITKEQAIQNVKNYINDNYKNMPLNFEVIQDLDENNTNAYVVHFYNAEGEKLSNHASTTNGWYYVDKKYGNVISMYDI